MEERKRSNVVRLALLGAVAGGVGLVAMSGGDPVQRNRYNSVEDCKADYTEEQCKADTPVDGNRTGVHTTSYYGPNGPVANFNNGAYPAANAVSGASADSYRLTALLGDNTARIIQLVWRVRW